MLHLRYKQQFYSNNAAVSQSGRFFSSIPTIIWRSRTVKLGNCSIRASVPITTKYHVAAHLPGIKMLSTTKTRPHSAATASSTETRDGVLLKCQKASLVSYFHSFNCYFQVKRKRNGEIAKNILQIKILPMFILCKDFQLSLRDWRARRIFVGFILYPVAAAPLSVRPSDCSFVLAQIKQKKMDGSTVKFSQNCLTGLCQAT